MNTTTKKVQRILLEQMHDSGIEYKYLLTIDYPYRQTNYNKVILDNKHLRRTIRKFYKSDIHMMFFIEKHIDPASNHFGGYHRHVLLQDAPRSRWLEPTGGMQSFLLNIAPEEVFKARMGHEPPEEVKAKLLKTMVRELIHSAPNGFLGTDVQVIKPERGGIEGVVGYCTKQCNKFHPSYEVVDPSSSDIDAKPLLELHHGRTSGNRYEAVSC